MYSRLERPRARWATSKQVDGVRREVRPARLPGISDRAATALRETTILIGECRALAELRQASFYLRHSVATKIDSTPMLRPAQRCSGLSFVAVCARRDTLCESEEVCITSLHTVVATFSYKSSRRLIEAGLLVGLVGALGLAVSGRSRGVTAIAGLLLAVGLGPGSRRRALWRLALPAPIGSAASPSNQGEPCSGRARALAATSGASMPRLSEMSRIATRLGG